MNIYKFTAGGFSNIWDNRDFEALQNLKNSLLIE